MPNTVRNIFVVLICAVVKFSPAAEIDFAHEIAPLLKEQCGKCHTADAKKGGLSLNTRSAVLTGGENGKVVVVGKSGESELIKRITAGGAEFRMPPEGARLSAQQVALLKRWIDEGLAWDEGFSFGKRSYEPPLRPRRPELPPVVEGRVNPIDRQIDAYLSERKSPRPASIDDATFARRVYLDLIGLLPQPEELEAFLADTGSDKRAGLVRRLLARDVDYAEHWLTFWNDLLRNDYTGTGFITGGRKQISKWLYDALVNNKPYNRLARELIAPAGDESRGFIEGIRWRGEVSAGQTVEIQFAQSVGQSFLGINLKCASCHDSFIDRWKLDESFGLAAIYATQPLEIHRCDVPTGRKAQAAWLFPELGQVDAAAPQPERLKQLAALLTHPENGRFTRTIVNRLWQRLMGRGIVHPVDAMQSEPWNADMLDYLGVHLSDNGYDLKKTLELIATSEAYQSQTQAVEAGADDGGYVYAGPRAKRLTAEQFMDALWQLTGEAPQKYDAPVIRGKADPRSVQAIQGKWAWSTAESTQAPAGETIAFRKGLDLPEAPKQAFAVVTCDNSYTLFANGQRVQAGENWEAPDAVLLTNRLKKGANEILIVAKNGGSGPNPAGLFFEGRITLSSGESTLPLDETWQWSKSLPDASGKYNKQPPDWQPAAVVAHPEVWATRVQNELSHKLSHGASAANLMVRASLVKSDFLMRSLGRPNRDQIVTVRPDNLSTLEAIDLSNGQVLADALQRGAKRLARQQETPTAFVDWLFAAALSRPPTNGERRVLLEGLGDKLTERGVEDALWTVIMLPEFQLVR